MVPYFNNFLGTKFISVCYFMWAVIDAFLSLYFLEFYLIFVLSNNFWLALIIY